VGAEVWQAATGCGVGDPARRHWLNVSSRVVAEAPHGVQRAVVRLEHGPNHTMRRVARCPARSEDVARSRPCARRAHGPGRQCQRQRQWEQRGAVHGGVRGTRLSLVISALLFVPLLCAPLLTSAKDLMLTSCSGRVVVAQSRTGDRSVVRCLKKLCNRRPVFAASA